MIEVEKHTEKAKVQPNMNLDHVMYWTYCHNPQAVSNMLLMEIRDELRKISEKLSLN